MSNFFSSPDVFIREVLEQYHIGKKSIADIAKFYDIPKAAIVRIIELYEFSEATRTYIKKATNELEDKARKGEEKITEEDFKDLELDLKLFEKKGDIDEENKK